MPERIQRKRTKGWRMPENTICVTRGTQFGNPYPVGRLVIHVDDRDHFVDDAAEALRLYREWLAWQAKRGYALPVHQLRGKNLACWCPLDQPCHADVLLEIANK